MTGFKKNCRKWGIVSFLALCIALAGCSDKDGNDGATTETGEVVAASISESEEQKVTVEEESSAEEEVLKEEPLSADAAYLFEAVNGWEFEFSSGAGAWDTTLKIEKNGEFSGVFHDRDAGDTGEGYPNGTLYLSLFDGKLTDVKKLSEYVYEARVTDLTYRTEVGKQEIVDGEMRIYSEAYGISKAEKINVYLPGAKITELPEEYLGWVGGFSAYVYGNYYVDYPTELPYCGIYEPVEKNGFSSTNVDGKNSVYLINEANFPGLKSIRKDMNEDGTYFYQDMDELGMYCVTNLCYRSDVALDQTDKFINDVVSHFVEGQSYQDLYYLDFSFADSMPTAIYMDGRLTYMAGWTCGSNEDTRYYVARMTKMGNYVYAYGYSASEYDKLMHGEAGGFFLGSITFSGDANKISGANDHKIARTIAAAVINNGTDPARILADEVIFIRLSDEDLMEEYHVTEEDMPNDYAILELDGIYKEYVLSPDCPVYVQYPTEGPFSALCDLKRFHNILINNTDGCLMILFLDENDNVVFMYEPFCL